MRPLFPVASSVATVAASVKMLTLKSVQAVKEKKGTKFKNTGCFPKVGSKSHPQVQMSGRLGPNAADRGMENEQLMSA